MSSNHDNSKKTKRGPAQPWIVNSFGVSSPSSSKPSKHQQRTLMSAPAFAISSKSTRAEHDEAAGDQTETPAKKLRREGVASSDGSGHLDLAGSSTEAPAEGSSSTRPHPLAQPTPLVHRPPSKPLTTTPSRHPPPPPSPAYLLSRPPGPSTISPRHSSKPLSRISDLLPSPLAPSTIKPDPSLESPTMKKKPLTVGLSGIAAGKIRVVEEDGGEGSGGGGGGGGTTLGVDEWATGMLNGKSPSKGKKAFMGILPLTSSTSLLLSSHSISLKHFFAPTKASSHTPRRPQPDLHLLVLAIAPPEIANTQLNPRLLRTICKILPPPRALRTPTNVAPASTSDSDPFALPPPPPPLPTTTTTNDADDGQPQREPRPKLDEHKFEDDELEEEESMGTVMLMLPADGSLGVGRKEGVGIGKTVRGWRPWLEVGVGGEGGERVLMLDRFEVE